MSKIIISGKILGTNFINVALAHAEYIINKNGLDVNAIQNELNRAKSNEDFRTVYHKHFGDEIILK